MRTGQRILVALKLAQTLQLGDAAGQHNACWGQSVVTAALHLRENQVRELLRSSIDDLGEDAPADHLLAFLAKRTGAHLCVDGYSLRQGMTELSDERLSAVM